MQKESRKGLLKILKGYRDLQKSALKMNENDLNDFRSDLKLLRNFFKSFENASEGEIEFKDLNEDFNENQFKAEWAWLKPERVQQRLLWYIICDYIWKENPYSEPSSFFKFIVYLLQDFDLWIKKMQKEAEAETHLKKYQFNAEDFLWYQKVLYLFRNNALFVKMMMRHHNDLYVRLYKYEKTFKIIWRKVF